ncbi:Glycine/D-amino acid oxidases family [Streptococcus sp. DD11]|uniref:NAD(P)/FAD-dependent oxidoreductase n=1 Tax=Streptococcus sp. DD11 TaxID=1777879 RepID=UPI000799623C|nr:FAD-dependent oxidoreductase [Streptococcus sp. DD11]KXT83895.1 Glycine/D-amino acid oxidases family [Streptococcus sp. DD11]
MKRMAVIGAGIVGSTAAYYLSRYPDVQVTVFDHGIGQATKAAAGIISPWFSKRRNQAWYRMARLGADFYQNLLADLEKDGISTDFYQQTGVCLLKKDESKLQELYDLAAARRKESPLIGDLQFRTAEQLQESFPGLTGFERLLYASGGARVEGSLLTETLLKASGAELCFQKVDLQPVDQGYVIDGRHFDSVILAAGAWLGQVLSPLGYEVDVRPQKGQLRDFKLAESTDRYPVVMPEGELDIIPFTKGSISVGASHENDQGFDLTVDLSVLDQLQKEAEGYLPKLAAADILGERVGTRAYTSDFSPFFGPVPGLPQVYAASGLGSSGLTTGPLIGRQLAHLALGEAGLLDSAIEKYVKQVDS